MLLGFPVHLPPPASGSVRATVERALKNHPLKTPFNQTMSISGQRGESRAGGSLAAFVLVQNQTQVSDSERRRARAGRRHPTHFRVKNSKKGVYECGLYCVKPLNKKKRKEMNKHWLLQNQNDIYDSFCDNFLFSILRLPPTKTTPIGIRTRCWR